MAGFMVWIVVTISPLGTVHEPDDTKILQYATKAKCAALAKYMTKTKNLKYKCVKVPYRR
jgi:hypothetical protein